MERWHLLDDRAADAAENMATDEALLQTVAARGLVLLRVYRWTEPSLSFGYFQAYPEELAESRPVIRRPTGGGMVHHGRDTTYTMVVPPSHWLFTMGAEKSYRIIHEAIARSIRAELHQAAVASPRGQYECFQSPVSGDVVLNGRKVAGAAQRRTKWGMIHQGSIAERLSTRQVAAGFEETMRIQFEAYQMTTETSVMVRKLVLEKYGTIRWNRRFAASASVSSN